MHAGEAAQVYVLWICINIQLYLQIIRKCIFVLKTRLLHAVGETPEISEIFSEEG